MYNQLTFEPKDPTDQNTYSVDFTLDLDIPNGETITGATIKTSIVGSNIPTTLTTSPAGIIGSVVGTYITGGIAGTQYLITYSVQTSFTNVITRSVFLYCQAR